MCFKRATECGLLALLLALLPAYVRLASSMPTATSAGSALRVALHTAGEDTLAAPGTQATSFSRSLSVTLCQLAKRAPEKGVKASDNTNCDSGWRLWGKGGQSVILSY
jgi:hypothetical protein